MHENNTEVEGSVTLYRERERGNIIHPVKAEQQYPCGYHMEKKNDCVYEVEFPWALVYDVHYNAVQAI